MLRITASASLAEKLSQELTIRCDYEQFKHTHDTNRLGQILYKY